MVFGVYSRQRLTVCVQIINILIETEIGVPLTDDTPNVDLKERAEAARNTALKLVEHGLDLNQQPKMKM